VPKVNVYLPDDLAEAVRQACVPVSAVCQHALARAVANAAAIKEVVAAPGQVSARRGSGPLTARAGWVLQIASDEARRRGHTAVGTEHLLLGILTEGENLGVKVLDALEIDRADVTAELDRLLRARHGPAEPNPAATPAIGSGAAPGGDADELSTTPKAIDAIERARQEALRMGHNCVGCEHLLLGLISEPSGLAGRVLRSMGAELTLVRRAVTSALTGYVHARQNPSPLADAEQASRQPGPDEDDHALLQQILARLDQIESRIE
jgi:ATP-dependent Clp protease ATP-binding subunit ClpA